MGEADSGQPNFRSPVVNRFERLRPESLPVGCMMSASSALPRSFIGDIIVVYKARDALVFVSTPPAVDAEP